MKNIKIGRESDNQIILPPDERISRYHATLEVYDDGSMMLRDHSRNGTNINGSLLRNSSKPVQKGDTIMFAGVARFDWGQIEQKDNRRPTPDNINPVPRPIRSLGIWIALPLIALLSGVGYTYRCNLFNIGCKTPPITVDLAKAVSNRYDKSVGTIVHAYYYKRKIVGNKTVFFGFNKKIYEGSGNLKFDYATTPDALVPFVSTGTGWLINSTEGNLITNRHVISPSWIANEKPEQLDPEVRIFLESMKDFIYEIETKVYKVRESSSELSTHTSLMRFLPNGADLMRQDDASLMEILNNVASAGLSATPLSYHREQEVDLALLRVDVGSSNYKMINPDTEIETNPDSLQGTNVVLLGYSGGLMVGYDNIKRKVRRTIQEGIISDDPSTYEIRYGIDTEGGSSGAPVFNKEQKIIAVHFAGRKSSGYGIPAKYIQDLLKHENVEEIQ